MSFNDSTMTRLDPTFCFVATLEALAVQYCECLFQIIISFGRISMHFGFSTNVDFLPCPDASQQMLCPSTELTDDTFSQFRPVPERGVALNGFSEGRKGICLRSVDRHCLGLGFWHPKISSKQSQADLHVKVELETGWPIDALFQL